MYSPTNGNKPESPVEPRPHFKSGSIDPSVVKVQDKWKKYRDKEGSFKNDFLDDVGAYLYKPIRKALETAVKGEEEQRLRVVSAIRDFLKDGEKKHQIDDCLRWLILFKTVEKVHAEKMVEDAAVKADILITQIIVEIASYLAFDNPYRPSKAAQALKTHSIKDRCKYPRVHGQHKDLYVKTSPFHMAASQGNYKAVKLMYDNATDDSGEPLEKDLLLHVLQSPAPEPSDQKSALWLAAVSSGGLGALKVLLELDPRIADHPDGTFEHALKEGKENVVNEFLQVPELRKVLITSEHIIQAIDCLSDVKVDAGAHPRRKDVVNTLIGHATTDDVINDQVVDKIIQLDLKDTWTKIIQLDLKDAWWTKKSPGFKLKTSRLLHLAVQHQNTEFVKMFLQDYPHSITHKENSKYPLWHNNKILTGSKWGDRMSTERLVKDKIRDMIVTATIKNKQIDKMQDLVRIFQDSGRTCILSTFIPPDVCPLLELIR